MLRSLGFADLVNEAFDLYLDAFRRAGALSAGRMGRIFLVSLLMLALAAAAPVCVLVRARPPGARSGRPPLGTGWERLNLFLLVVALAIAAARPVAGADLNPGQYRERLAAALDLARQAAAEPSPEKAVERLRRALLALPAQVTVADAGGDPVQVENRPAARFLERALGARTPAARRAQIRRFQEWGEVLQAVLAPEPPTRDPTELTTLQAILKRSEFQPSPIEQWNQRFRQWLGELLGRLFGNVAPTALDLAARGLYYLLLALLVVLLAYLIWTYVPGLRVRRPQRGARLEEAGVVTAPERASARLAAAEAAARAGRYLEALRHTYQAMLLLLDEAHILEYDPARTNREVLRRLSADEHAPVRELLTPLTETLDEKLYGGRPALAADYQSARDTCARLMGLVAP